MFDTLTPEDARGLVEPPADLDANRLFVGAPTPERPDARPDHWQNGEGYTGPLPTATADLVASDRAYVETLAATFVVEDVLSDVLQRRRNGLLGKPPGWSFEPDRDDAPEASGAGPSGAGPSDGDPSGGDDEAEKTPEEIRADEVTQTMQAWATTAGGSGVALLDVLKRWVDGMGYGGRACLRVFVPGGRRDQAEAASTPREALRHVFVSHMDADQAAVHTDADRMASVGVAVFAPEAETGALKTGATDATVEVCHLTSVDEEAATRIRVYASGETDAAPFEVDLGGRITVHEGRMRPLLDTGAVSNQRDLNTMRTMISINGHKAGFPKLFFIGVEPPTREVDDGAGGTRREPVAPEIGPGHQGFYSTQPSIGPDGYPNGTENGSVTQIGPVDNVTLREDARVAREAIYRGARQTHVLALFGADLSGEAMIQAQGEYVQDLLDAKGVVDAGGQWVLETVYRFACHLAGTPEAASGVRAVFDCRPNAGPLSAALREQIIRQKEAGLLSAETAMSLLGVDDTDAEKGRMAEERHEEEARRLREAGSLFGAFPALPAASGDGAAGRAPTDPADLDPQLTPEA